MVKKVKITGACSGKLVAAPGKGFPEAELVLHEALPRSEGTGSNQNGY